jgi:hypothetical protein
MTCEIELSCVSAIATVVGDLDLFGDRADLQRWIDHRVAVHAQHDPFLDVDAESLGRGCQSIRANRQIGYRVAAIGGADHGTAKAGLGLCDPDFRAGIAAPLGSCTTPEICEVAVCCACIAATAKRIRRGKTNLVLKARERRKRQGRENGRVWKTAGMTHTHSLVWRFGPLHGILYR